MEITDTPANQGHILGCIIAKKDDPLIHWVESCKAVINQVEALVFGDYHLIGGFVEKCGADIARLECGRILQDEESYHSQVFTSVNVNECSINVHSIKQNS